MERIDDIQVRPTLPITFANLFNWKVTPKHLHEQMRIILEPSERGELCNTPQSPYDN